MADKPLIKKTSPKLPKPVYHIGVRAAHLQEILIGTCCFYCGLGIPHKVTRVTCKRCMMNYCWGCIEHVKNYHTGNCLRCHGFDFTPLYNNIPKS